MPEIKIAEVLSDTGNGTGKGKSSVSSVPGQALTPEQVAVVKEALGEGLEVKEKGDSGIGADAAVSDAQSDHGLDVSPGGTGGGA